MKNFLEEDVKIRHLIRKKYPKGIIERIEINRDSTNIEVIISTPRPGLIIGRGGEGIEILRGELIKLINQIRNNKKPVPIPLKLEIQEIKKPELSAQILAEQVALDIERRLPYRRAIKTALAKIPLNEIGKGAKIKVAGRLDGNEISRSDWLIKGKLPSQTIRSVIDYGESEAHCTYGVVGIKVWIYKGEKI